MLPYKRDLTLPVLQKSEDILTALATNDVLILVSETGSGKTTQLPQLILDSDRSASIVVTQPRRVAAITVASRVAAERGITVGDQVGYAVRFEDKSQRGLTRIRYVTDGVLLREALSDGFRGLKKRYSHVIIDEVHERSVNTDIVLGIIKETLTAPTNNKTSSSSLPPKNEMLSNMIRSKLAFKVVIMSATTDAEKIALFFRNKTSLNVKQLGISGRSHSVKRMMSSEPVRDYVAGAVEAALLIHTKFANPTEPGDILVFLPGQDDILAAISLLKSRCKKELSKTKLKRLTILPLFAAQSRADQLRAIEPLPDDVKDEERKLVFSTNIAETSITIPDIKYVIDSCMVKVRTLIHHNGIYTDVLKVQPVSMAQAEQRKGRAGRTMSGGYFGLCTEQEYNKLDKYPTPEILRVDASATLLKIIALRHSTGKGKCSDDEDMKNQLTFPLLDKIPKPSKERALETLLALGAIDSHMKLTKLGQLMARIPTGPMLARSLIESWRIGCLDAMLSVGAILSVEGGIFLMPSSKMDEAKAAHRRFLNPCGDHLTLVNVLNCFMQLNGASRKMEFCRDHFLNYRTLVSAESVRAQLNGILRHGDIVSWSLQEALPLEIASLLEEASIEELVRRCLVCGFFRNIARKRAEDGKYVPIGNAHGSQVVETGVDIHPSSALRSLRVKRNPALVIYDELVWTSKMYLRRVVSIEEAWVPSHSNNYFKKREVGG